MSQSAPKKMKRVTFIELDPAYNDFSTHGDAQDLRHNERYVGRLVGSYQGVEAGQLPPVGAYHP